jgi:Flp pilus assembly protein TadD
MLATTRAALAALLLAAGAAAADEDRTDPLDELFAALSDPQARGVEATQRRIAELWSRSGSDAMDLLLSRGRKAMEAEEFAKADDHLTALIELAPDFAEGWNARATVNFLREEYWAAVSDIQRALALEPRHFGALSGLGVILERIGDEAGALRAFREAARLNPHLDQARSAADRLAGRVEGRDI